jgi:DNA processing protein
VGPVRWRTLLVRHAGDADRALREAAPSAPVRDVARRVALDAMVRARRARLDLTLLGEPEYPAGLLELSDAPPALWSRGDRAVLGVQPAVALVGTRAASPYGLRCARALATALARVGAIVVSGMARGVDGAAHEAALDAGAPSVAVLGTGADVAYPAAHRALHARLGAVGVVLSESWPGAAATPGAFPRRNRLIAALAQVTVVVEAGVKSGALITAAHALDLGRSVGAVPGPIDSACAAGCNALLRDGAHVLATAADVLTLAGCDAASPVGAASAAPGAPPTAPPGLGDDERALWNALGAPASGPDVLAERTGLPARRCMTALTALELAGLVESGWGGSIARR